MPELVELSDGVPTIDFRAQAVGARTSADVIARAGSEAIAHYGCVRLREVFEPTFIEQLRREHDATYARYISQMFYADARSQGHRRTLITLEIEGGFARPEFYANPRIYAILRALLGQDFILGHLASILSRPGSADQFVHRDTPSLFSDDTYDAFLPPVGVAMVLPFIDLDTIKGGTRVWPGTNNVAGEPTACATPSVDVYLEQGSCLLFDVRTVHGGIGNRSDSMRSIVYAAYHRHWFRDWDGFDSQAPISVSAREFERVPGDLKHLFAWRFDRFARQRPKVALRRAVSSLPDPMVKVVNRLLRSHSG